MRTEITAVSAQGRELRVETPAVLPPDARDAVRVEANRWVKRLRQVDYDGRSMRERFRYRGDSLWWFTELYLHKMRRLETAVETVLALETVCEQHAPSRLVVRSNSDAARLAATSFGAARGIGVEAVSTGGARTDLAWQGYLVGLTARLSRLRRSASEFVPVRPAVAAFVHTAFWREIDGESGAVQESYIGPVLSAVERRLPPDQLFCVGVGPRRNFRARRWWDPLTQGSARPRVTPIERLAPKRRLEEALALWRRREVLAAELTAGDAIRDAAVYRGVNLWPVLERELTGVAVAQWPWSARAMDEAAAALDQLAPGTIVTYAEAGGWGRALVLEARRRGIRSIGIQHGFIYRHWLNYLHEADELEPRGGDPGAPIPDRTLVFDEFTADHLRRNGRFPPGALAVTGSARLDDLAEQVRAAREAGPALVRAALGVAEGERLVVLAAKHSEVADELPALVAAAGLVPGTRLVIKVHPAETPAVYEPALAGSRCASVAPPDVDLARLLAAADGLVTMNSTVAIDGLVLGVPALVIGLPNNLSPFVDARVMLGAVGAEAVRQQLHRLLYDPGVRNGLLREAASFAARHGIRSDGHAAERAADEVLSSTPGT